MRSKTEAVNGANGRGRRLWPAGAWVWACLFFLALTPRLGAVATSGERVDLPGSVVDVPTAQTNAAGQPQAHVTRTDLAPEETNATMEFEMALQMRDLDELQARVANDERIAPDEMAEKYSPLPEDYAAVEEWLTSQGFSITQRDPGRVVIFAKGTVAQVADAFGVTFARVVGQHGAEYTSAITTPSVPAELASVLVGVNGLQPHLHPHKHLVHPASASGFSPPYFPKQIATAYGASNLTVTGAGQTIAIVIDAFPATSDISLFWTTCGITQSLSNITFVPVGGGPTNSEDADEASLDVEWSSSIATGAKVRVYGPSSLDDTPLDQAYAQIYSDVTNSPSLNIHMVSMSYGGSEAATTQSQINTDDQLFAELAAAGVTLFASSGDDGSDPGGPTAPESPASDPNVTGVGGTSITMNTTTGAVTSETAWDDSGGGYSEFFPVPSWQTGTGVLGIYGGRMVPDIAAPADPNTGCLLILNGVSETVGGTSWGSPTWAAFCALINQARANNSEATLGLLTPKIYPLLLSASFRDITSGNNGAYSAGVGYDMLTGLGVPVFPALLQELVKVLTPPENDEVMAGDNATFTITAGGNGTPTLQWERLADGASTWANLTNGGAYSGVTTTTLTINDTTGNMSGDEFECLVNGTLSPAATLVVIAQPYLISTISGQAGVSGNANGNGTSAEYSFPNDVALDASGNLYIADTNNDTVRKMTLAGVVTTLAGSPGVPGSTNGSGSTARLDYDNSIDVDSSGNIYVADSANNEIRKITQTSGNIQVTTFAGSTTSGTKNGNGTSARFDFPAGIAVDSGGNIYVADSNNNLIRKITPAGNVATLAGSGAAGSTNGNGTAASFSFPAAVAVDSGGNVYVADAGNNVIRKITPAGVVTTLAGQAPYAGINDGTGNIARFNYPSGIAVDTSGNVYVTDTNNNTIRKVTAAGVVTTLLGQPGIEGSNDGVGNVAQFNQPYGLVLDSSGNIYIADTFNHTIRKAIPAFVPQIQTQPQSETVILGANAAFSVTANGTPNPSYQWQVQTPGNATWTNLSDGATFNGSATSNLAINATTLAMSGDELQCVVSNGAGSVTSASATLTIEYAPVITLQPVSQVVSAGPGAIFSVAASGLPAPSYQWQSLPAGGGTWSNLTDNATYTGSATPTLTITATTNGMSGSQYRCVVSNGISPNAISNAALLTVYPAGYLTWAAGLSLSGSSAATTATPFADTIPNLVRYAMGLGASPSASQLPSLSISTVSGTEYLTLQFNELTNLTGLQLVVEYSYDLQNWFDLPTNDIAQIANPNSQTSAYEASVAIPPTGPVFMRIIAVPSP
jgi:kumamolisin